MGYSALIRKMVILADQQTIDLQSTVLMYAWIGFDDYGAPKYDIAVPIQAIVAEKQFTRRLPDGSEIDQKAIITIPRPITPNGALNRKGPVDPRDKFVLPSGYTGPIQYVDGPIDPLTKAPFSFEIILG